MTDRTPLNMRELDALIDAGLEGTVTPLQTDRLNALLRDDARARARYIDYLDLHATLADSAGPLNATYPTDHYDDRADIMAEVIDSIRIQQHADRVAKEAADLVAQEKANSDRKHQEQLALMRKGNDRPVTRQYIIPKIVAGLGLAAAIMLVAIPLATLFQDKPESNQQDASTPDAIETPYIAPVLANVVRTLDAQWLDGDDLWNGTTGLREGKHHLAQGLVEIELSKGTRVVLEAPVTFELTGTNALKLSQGRLVATVPPAAIGFTIDTPSAHIIDYGTEFGVEALVNGVTQAHVFNGEIHTAPRINSEVVGEPVALFEQEAISVATGSTVVRRVTVDAASFERRVVKRLDLVDIVAGGDGTGQARMRGIHPQTGRVMSRGILGYSEAHLASSGRYIPVPSNTLIDGVFIPHRANGIQIDSTGRTISGLAVADPRSYGLFWAGGLMPSYLTEDAMRQRIASMYPDNPNEAPVLYMISNKGITFDLQAMREAAGSVQAIRFLTEIENVANSAGNDTSRADIHLYLDGEPIDSVVGLRPGDDRYSIEIAAQSDRRFLTVVVADGGDGLGTDWIVMHQPVLEVLIAEADAGDSP